MTETTQNSAQTPTQKRILTGITTSGIPHLGNYVGAIRPAIQSAMQSEDEAYFFLADLHALIKCSDPNMVHASTKAIAATWLACGLDPERVTFYRQSDIIEIPELSWVLSCNCAKGLMNRAHAYKAQVDINNATPDTDPDYGISMGLFSYPVLMAADILMFNATHVPVGKDQIQHLEMARDIAGTFNFKYCQDNPLFVLPKEVVDEDTPLLTGLDGRKMSKSYGNTIPLFGEDPQVDGEKALKKAIMRIVTNSQLPEEPKNADDSTIFEIYRAFATPAEQAELRQRFETGIGWGEAKEILFEKINSEIAPFRERYNHLMANPKELEEILQLGAEKARRESRKRMEKVRKAIGIKPLAKLKK
ncbi:MULTISPECIES: tryptophan--tRNA ligase [unclassified Moraxella]|uniref:tryptophan--tRNA ligase n=1 Tax=unclassified Moraxella TaxID=2685852 RepID=UPI003AF8FAC8